MKKPSDCTCGFPEVHAQTATGHRANCPAHRRWLDVAVSSGVYQPGPGRIATDPSLLHEALNQLRDAPLKVGVDGNVVTCTCLDRARAASPSNISGHFEDCPAHALIMADHSPTPTPPQPMEDRGTPVWIWANHSHEMFQLFDDATSRYEISVPIGWEMRPDPHRGVVLRSVFRKVLTAHDALNLATCAEEGFRVRHQQRIGAAHIGV